jgi:hypothetical protein
VSGDEDPNLTAIKERLALAKAAISRGDASVDIRQFTMGQLGVSIVVADASGRIWRYEGGHLVRLRYRQEF